MMMNRPFLNCIPLSDAVRHAQIIYAKMLIPSIVKANKHDAEELRKLRKQIDHALPKISRKKLL